jgi:hypothetical protein
MYGVVVFVWKVNHMSPILEFLEYQKGFFAWVWCSFWKKHKFNLADFGFQHALTVSFLFSFVLVGGSASCRWL